jgi:F0F1-type ATP synthase alpha subunit
MVPIGHGQHELIISNCQTGKTAIAINTIHIGMTARTREKKLYSAYVAVAQLCTACQPFCIYSLVG